MQTARFPYLTDYVNEVFARERERWDFVFLRPVILVTYFFVRCIAFPIKFVLHRRAYGFEAKVIDWCMAMGIKYLATADAAELFIRHMQIEPLLYRHILSYEGNQANERQQAMNGVAGGYAIPDTGTVKRNNSTLGHDQLTYEIMERFDKDAFLEDLDAIRERIPEDHSRLSKAVLEENHKHSLQLLGPTNVVLTIVMAITIFGDLNSSVRALNSFGSDSLVLWCLKRLYADDPSAQHDLDFFMQEMGNRGHYNLSVFFSNPSQYLYSHLVFEEVVYELLTQRPPKASAD